MRTNYGLLGLIILLAARPATAQRETVLRPDSTPRAIASIGPTTEASRLLRSRMLTPAPQANAAALRHRLFQEAAPPSNRGAHALIGGFIGSAAGVVVCTAISNLAKDQGTGFSTCTSSGYLGFGLGGFVVGGLVGFAVK